MSVSLWRWTKDCEGQFCPGDCDLCDYDPEEDNGGDTEQIGVF